MSSAQTNPFMGLMARPVRRMPPSANVVTVIEGRRVSGPVVRRGQKLATEVALDGFERDERAEREAMLRRERERAYHRAKYQRKKSDPAYMARRRAWYERNREAALARVKAWTQANRERVREAQRESARRIRMAGTEEQRLRRLAANAKWVAANREKVRAKARERARVKAAEKALLAPPPLPRDEVLAAQRERKNAASRAWYARNREAQKARTRAYHERKKAELAAKGVAP